MSSDLNRSNALDAPLTEGSLWKAIWTMSWPLVITTICLATNGMVDVQVAGFLGSDAQAAVGLAEQVLFVFSIFTISIGVGATAVVSQGMGAKSEHSTINGTAQSMLLSVLVGCVILVVLLISINVLIPVFSSSVSMQEQGSLYLRVIGLYLVPFSIVCTVNAVFRAIGDAKTPLMIMGLDALLCISGDYLTVLGNWPVPNLGVTGIAYAAVFANTTAAIFALWRLSKSPLKQSLKKLLPLDWTMMKRIIHIGLPSAFHRMSWPAAVFVVFFILKQCKSPVQAIASWSIGLRIESFIFMPLMALSLAVTSIVGQNVGAKQIKRAFKAAWHVTFIGIGLMLILATALFLLAEQLAGLMTHDPKAIEYTAGYLRFNALCEPVSAIAMVLSGALQGAGDSRTPMWISIFCQWIVRLPLAWVLALNYNMGPTGVWIAMAISNTISGFLTAWRFQSGSWIKIKV